MTYTEAKALRLGDVVIWNGDRSDRGVVVDRWPRGVAIQWAKPGTTSYTDLRDLALCSRVGSDRASK
jgi:hypothetical protein